MGILAGKMFPDPIGPQAARWRPRKFHFLRRVERIRKEWIDEVRQRVEAGREFHDAVRVRAG